MHPHSPAADPKSNPHAPSLAPRGPDWWLMMKAFLKKGRSIASFAPSSRFMARRVVDGIDFESARCIVELGAGTGPITAELIKRVKPHTKLLVIELDPNLCGRLKARFPQVDVVQGDACHFDKLLADRGLNQVDHICSGLPLPSFPSPLRDAILDTSARMLATHGTFRQLTVMPLIYYRMYRRYFGDVRFRFVPLNMPPGGVYVCRGYRDAIAP
ncbi:MAG TPA: rRNA adenine N-6-methyltransferase family protein [Urbifossiella sp.]|jgi:phospholipid N-methyltransferase|nr:rRNA adenine N-6-methyltransferase family protein [Urbifossiella sp.]